MSPGFTPCPTVIPQLPHSTSFSGFGFPFILVDLPAVQEAWIQSVGWNPLVKGDSNASRVFLPGEFRWTKEPGGL